jgi:hypothetical protein
MQRKWGSGEKASLILYQDAFEIANPLGSAETKYKILGFFYFEHLESHNRSAIDHMQLLMLATEVKLENIGKQVFRRLADNLRLLERQYRGEWPCLQSGYSCHCGR